jgi:hypothetical protein
MSNQLTGSVKMGKTSFEHELKIILSWEERVFHL